MEQGCQQLKGHDDMRGARWQIATRRTWSHSPQVLLWIAAHGEREPAGTGSRRSKPAPWPEVQPLDPHGGMYLYLSSILAP